MSEPRLLIDYLRDDCGLRMAGFVNGRHVGWTTDKAKARKAELAGATVIHVGPDFARVPGAEVSCHADAEVVCSVG